MNPRAAFPVLVCLLLVLLAAGTGCTAPDGSASSGPPAAAGARVAPEALARFVPPAPPGWQLVAPPSAAVLPEGGVTLVSVTANYVPAGAANGTGNRSADLVIQDTGGQVIGLRRLVDALPATPGPGDPTVRTELRGHPAVVFRDTEIAGAYVVVADRFVVSLAVAGGLPADFDAFVAAIDLDGLSLQR